MKLSSLLAIINYREIAIIFWSCAFIICMLFVKNVREAFVRVLKAFFIIKIIIPLVALLVYVGIILIYFNSLNIWELPLLIKGTIIWLVYAFSHLFNTKEAFQDKTWIKKVLLQNLNFTILFGIYTFSMAAELVLIPVITVIVMLAAVAGTNVKYSLVKKVLDNILAVVGLGLLIFTVNNIIKNIHNIALIDILWESLLPILLTISFMPFLYLFALFVEYESVFIRICYLSENNKKLIKFTKHKIIRLCHINLLKLRSFWEKHGSRLIGLKSENELLVIIQQFKKSQNNPVAREATWEP